MRKKMELSKCGNFKPINKLTIYGKAVYNDKQVANALNEYFSNVGNTLSEQISNKNRSYKDYFKNPLLQSIYVTPTDEKEIFSYSRMTCNQNNTFAGLILHLLAKK